MTPHTSRWAWMQLAGGALSLPIVSWTSYAYVAHERDVTLGALALSFLIVGSVWGLIPIVVASVLNLTDRNQRWSRWLGLSGAIQACVMYVFGLWVFTFRYPPHWSLYAMELVAAFGAVLALTAALVQARSVAGGPPNNEMQLTSHG